MRKVIFTYNRELMHFVIDKKDIWYTDKRWKAWVKCLPKPEDFDKKVRASRNAIPAFILKMFQFSEEDLRQHKEAKTEEELAEIIIKDARLKGCRLILNQKTEGDESIKALEVNNG